MEYILSKVASKDNSTLLSSGEFILPIFSRVMLLFSKMIVKMQGLKVLQRIWIKICAEACSVWLWEFFRCTSWHMSTAGVKAIPFRKLLVKWIDNGNTYFKYFNSIVAQMLNTVMQHLLSRSTGVISSCKLPLEDIC